ncbi:MAG TPA: sigma-70 family RNA polymerase sigma factor [Myxococcales bacterium]|nr:sigma-70 family RNA polymerase sigma factor [Myxococcales bacterium]HIM01774.1 sigma-70 family RNA polymerase sigma factor [Myxococcales bacterium]
MRDADPDAQLMLAFCAGDGSAFDSLFDRWGGPLLHYLERMVVDSGTAEELVQEVFLRVYRAKDRYRPEAKFSTWLYRIGTNLALNELRRPSRSRPHSSMNEEPSNGGPVLRLVSDTQDAGDSLDVRRRANRVEGALAELPERQRMAIWLSAVEGMSYAEVAETLETSEKSVKALVHRARSALVENVRADDQGSANGLHGDVEPGVKKDVRK